MKLQLPYPPIAAVFTKKGKPGSQGAAMRLQIQEAHLPAWDYTAGRAEGEKEAGEGVSICLGKEVFLLCLHRRDTNSLCFS